MLIGEIAKAFYAGWCDTRPYRSEMKFEEKQLREELSEDQVDEMLESTFPASDPPSTY
jgi:hypothetical protein